MTTVKPKKVSDIIEEIASQLCPVKRTLYFVREFLKGPMCGRCFPCEMGSYEARLRLKSIMSENGTIEDIAALRTIGEMMLVTSMCKKGKDCASYILEHIDDKAFEEHVAGTCADKQCKSFIEYRNVPDNCIRCGKCKEACSFDAIIGEKQISHKCCYLPFEIRQKRCTKCGECIKVCPTGAIVIVNIDVTEEAPV